MVRCKVWSADLMTLDSLPDFTTHRFYDLVFFLILVIRHMWQTKLASSLATFWHTLKYSLFDWLGLPEIQPCSKIQTNKNTNTGTAQWDNTLRLDEAKISTDPKREVLAASGWQEFTTFWKSSARLTAGARSAQHHWRSLMSGHRLVSPSPSRCHSQQPCNQNHWL